ncbi:MAG: SMC-Scp complex subunit ScpB [Patescibacteria group bacterium]
MNLDAKIESLLFWKAEPIAIAKIAKIFSVTEEEIKNALTILEEKFQNRGVVLMRKEDEVALRTAPASSEFIETLAKEELVRDLGKAGLETLSIILYQGPISRREIDYVRGVNSNFILRNLLIRGLVEKVENPKDLRSFLYKPTFDLLSHLGIAKIEDLPEYGTVKKEIELFSEAVKESEVHNPEALIS